jgi:hypothetical protein
LQKGFLSRDQAPKEEEMPSMTGFLKQLEEFEDLEAAVIKDTKVHKVLRGIIKLETIPNEEGYNFKTRSNNLLTKWSGALAADTETTEASAAVTAPATNGVKHNGEEKADAQAPKNLEEISAAPEPAKTTDADGDTAMAEAKEDVPVAQADTGSSADGSVDAAKTAVV